MDRTANCLAKLDRMNKSLRHQEPDRVPISDFFWGSFLKRWREDLGLPADTDIYKYYDLDWIVTIPNMDPHIKQFETIRETDEEVVVRTGFEAIIRKKFLPDRRRCATPSPQTRQTAEEGDPRMKIRLAVFAATFAVVSPALAADTYQFDKSHTTVGFQVRHIFTMLGGKFQDISGTIRVDRAKPESSSVEFTIQAASIFTNDAKRDEHLRSPDFFDVAAHPTITFKSTAVKPLGYDVYEVTGDLTMRGVTKRVTLPVTFLGEGKDPWGNEKMGFELATTLNRKDYGINWNKALDQGGVLVGDEVKVQISVEANKVKQTAEAR